MDIYTVSLAPTGPRLNTAPLMPPSSSPVLERLHRLDKSSVALQDRLDAAYWEEYKQSVSNLQTNDVLWLADYLDKVRPPASIPTRYSQVWRTRLDLTRVPWPRRGEFHPERDRFLKEFAGGFIRPLA